MQITSVRYRELVSLRGGDQLSSAALRDRLAAVSIGNLILPRCATLP